MSDADKPGVGTIGWIDLTVDDAEQIRDFYAEVVGWRPEPVDMGGYNDFNMNPPTGAEPVAGVCHARGSNAVLPHKWLIYITVDDLGRSASRCRQLGGELLVRPKAMGRLGRFCVIRDPVGAVAALFEPCRNARSDKDTI